MDNFHLESIRLDQNFDQSGIKKISTSIPIQKPKKHQWFCISPNGNHQHKVAIIEFSENKEVYVISHNIQAELVGEWDAKLIVLCITKQDDYFFWPVKLPDSSGYLDSWNRSAMEIINTTSNKWIRVLPNKAMGRYDYLISERTESPKWTEEPIESLLGKALIDRVITSTDHHIIKQLKGVE